MGNSILIHTDFLITTAINGSGFISNSFALISTTNPLAWMICVDGFILDVRSAPRKVQEVAYAQGLIPYIPDNGKLENIDEKETSPHQNADFE